MALIQSSCSGYFLEIKSICYKFATIALEWESDANRAGGRHVTAGSSSN